MFMFISRQLILEEVLVVIALVLLFQQKAYKVGEVDLVASVLVGVGEVTDAVLDE